MSSTASCKRFVKVRRTTIERALKQLPTVVDHYLFSLCFVYMHLKNVPRCVIGPIGVSGVFEWGPASILERFECLRFLLMHIKPDGGFGRAGRLLYKNPRS